MRPLLLLALCLTACAPALSRVPNAAEGIASWYGPGFEGRLTANGEVFDSSLLTAAHQTLPFDTLVRVTNLNNGLAVVVRINDRGPFVGGRIIDLSRAAAERIDMIGSGTAPVRLELLSDMPAASWRVQMSSEVDGYDVLSRLHRPGELLLLRGAAQEPLLLRVVGRVPETEDVDLLLPRALFEALDLTELEVEVISAL
ncbi:rare lipoprotein A [Truepera radiovictrix DSM 17093]|uniref:Probable endolytic peptidoglycan transglycosylase RlpA n=1 Tax=Truepera radiovictrix (strain DSM 17093 / CIP 108686 / LMG 22925 / RQ-24) TaxID=649638 RepID=D7CSM1_TRURR|nr:septal ring lytic transglycosylase RlpA family protein [Truepera radiovictrix]ADI15441.1 rare lipoprotein A [Truepera radiovictrix DSM 17093]WMT56009.1 septal ring lytic transglycosylase RlpA family protein [Truepera radiovictrix]